MLAPCVVEEIRNLLTAGLSYRKIARATGVSRGSIGAIASGKRVDRAPREEEVLLRPAGPPERCPTCGGLVYLPCLLCATRVALAQSPWETPRDWPADESLALALEGEHRRRYEEVRFCGAHLPSGLDVKGDAPCSATT